MKKFGITSIIGVGMIGGSIGWTLKKKGLAEKVVGIGRNPVRLKKAKALGAIDEGYVDFDKGLKNAKIVMVCTPVSLIPEMIKKALPHLKKDSILTDVGSVKAPLIKEIEKILPQNIHFVGAHPIAGSESSGVENARPDLFQNCNCILTPTSNTNPGALSLIKQMWEEIGARVLLIDPLIHDEILAFTSHLPHLVAVSLVETLRDLKKKYKNIEKFAGTGFRDTTRVTLSSPAIWRDICITNKKAILKSLKKFSSIAGKIHTLISNNEWDKIFSVLNNAKEERDFLN